MRTERAVRHQRDSVIVMAVSIVMLAGLLVLGSSVPDRALAAGSCDLNYFNGLTLPDTTLFTVPSTSPYAIRTPGIYPQTTPISHCEVIGYINPRTGTDGKPYAIGFHLRLPTAWNGRFYFQGGSGTDGNLGDALGGGALALGYAVVSTDAGHDNTIDNDSNAGGTSAFGVDPQARLDYGYNALDQVTRTAKTIVSAYYGSSPVYSYFVGCSNGGRQGMVASQRFPTYFDGIVAGAPGFNLPKAAISGAWNAQALAPLATHLSSQNEPYLPDTFSSGDLALAANAILAACDALDGLVDGIVDNHDACTDKLVYPQLEAIECTGAKTASCLLSGQVQALKKIYAGPRNSRGRSLYSNWQWDAGITAPMSLRNWSLGSGPYPTNNALKLTLGAGSLATVFVTPPVITPTSLIEAYAFGFNFDTDAPKIFETFGPYTQSSMEFMSAHSTDLWPFKHHGGKMILYQGNSDGSFSPRDTTRWYEAMNEAMGDKARDFARLFLVPGMGHCGTGPGTTSFDTLTPLANWVEHGVAPDSIVATAPTGTPWPGRTRPLCPYPEIAAYTGGGTEAAANFICVPAVEVRIEPEVLNLHSKGAFTAFITLPEDYNVRDWSISDVTCQGVHAVRQTECMHGRTYSAKFETRDLVGVTPGRDVMFTVEGVFHHDGKVAPFSGADSVRVIKEGKDKDCDDR